MAFKIGPATIQRNLCPNIPLTIWNWNWCFCVVIKRISSKDESQKCALLLWVLSSSLTVIRSNSPVLLIAAVSSLLKPFKDVINIFKTNRLWKEDTYSLIIKNVGDLDLQVLPDFEMWEAAQFATGSTDMCTYFLLFSLVPKGCCNYSQRRLCAVRRIGLFPDASSVIHLEFRVSGTSGYTREHHQEYDNARDEIIYQTVVLVLATRESSIIELHTNSIQSHTHFCASRTDIKTI